MAFYRQLAGEVDSACRAGTLQCLPARASLIPPWEPGYGTAMVRTFARAALFTATFAGMAADPAPSEGTDSTQALYRELPHDRIAPLHLDVLAPRAAAKVRLLNRVLGLYRAVMPILAVLALYSLVVQAVEAIRRRRLSAIWVVQAGLLGALLARLVMLAYIDITSFPAVDPLYLTAAYPVLILLVFLALYERERMLSRRGPWWKRIFELPRASASAEKP